ncbi:MAG: LysM peptidoglycan-binding domain-containing protein, partial [Spirochaetes bacterium]|nr:LysM peptidoglycan-binding domain-containing protein [Spirochaetota bacterium]
MSDSAQTSSTLNKFRFVDILVLVVFFSTAVFGLYLFRQDLMRTIDARDMDPAGVIIIRNNIVQRRHDDRVLWDRIYVNSLVYPGDLVRVAELSSTAIDIEKNELFLNQNTLIRIQPSMGGNGTFKVELREGELSVTSGVESKGIMLDLMGKQVQTTSGSMLNASAGKEGASIQVNEGKVNFIQEGKSREITEGAMIAFDPKGVEQVFPAAVVMSPKPNARYLKNSSEKLFIDFSWNRINIDKDSALSLEIAGDSSFARNIRVINGLNNSAQAAFDNGFWYWRLIYEGKVLNSGQLTVVNSSGPVLVSPVNGSIFRYHDTPPQVRFQWVERQNVFGYVVEINDTLDFSAPKIIQQTKAALLVFSLDSGIWYWRVKPVFLSAYQGEASFSDIIFFQIIKTEEKIETAVQIEIPEVPPERITAVTTQSSRVSSEPSIAVVKSVVKPEAKQEIKPEEVSVRPNLSSTNAKAGRNYTIQAGDTLGRIARQYYGDPMQWSRISEANNIQDPDLIYPGQVFFIP